MPMIVSHKQRIFFALEGEHGPFLLLHHGLFGSHRDWYEWGFVKALARDYRLIIPDARGHGRSDKPLAADQYGLSQFGDDIITILDRLDVRTVNVIGYSLGAIVGCDLLVRYSGRARGAVLGGESPVVSQAALEEWEALARQLDTADLSQVVSGHCEKGRLACSNTQFPEDSINESAPVMLKAMTEWKRNEAGKIHLQSPLALFTGKDDSAGERIGEAAGRIAQARMISMDAATSADVMTSPDALLKAITEYFKDTRNRPDGEGRPAAGQRKEGGSPRGGRRPRGGASAAASVEPQSTAPDGARNSAESDASPAALDAEEQAGMGQVNHPPPQEESEPGEVNSATDADQSRDAPAEEANDPDPARPLEAADNYGNDGNDPPEESELLMRHERTEGPSDDKNDKDGKTGA